MPRLYLQSPCGWGSGASGIILARGHANVCTVLPVGREMEKLGQYQKGKVRPLFVLQKQGASYLSPKYHGKAQISDSFPLQLISQTDSVTSTTSKISLFFLLPVSAPPSHLFPRPWDVLFPDARNSPSAPQPPSTPDGQ